MSYIRVSWPDSQKYTELPEELLEQFEEEGLIVFGDDGSYLVDEDFIDELDRIIEEGIPEPGESELPEEMKEDIISLAKKYSSENGYKGDLILKETMPLASRESNVYGFYVFQGWIYLLDDDGADIDPNDVEMEFLEKFTDYIADDRNVKPEE